MTSQQLLWGIGWLLLGFSAIALINTQPALEPRVKQGLQVGLGLVSLVGAAKIWGFLV